GAAEGTVQAISEPSAKREVLKFDFKAPAGTACGVWSKGYSAQVAPPAYDGVEAAALDPQGDAAEYELSLEIKGTLASQAIPLKPQKTWTPSKVPIDWEKIGALKEAVFVVKPAAGKSAQGSVLFDLQF